MHAHEVEALPASEFHEWIAHFQLAAERRDKKGKGPQNQIPKKERERREAERLKELQGQFGDLPSRKEREAAGDVSTG